jgi:hypothetical protein
MSGIHRIILNRLLAAWVVVSLATGAAVSWLGVSKIDGQLVALATSQLEKLSAASLPLVNQPESGHRALNALATDFVRRNFIAAEFRDRNRKVVATAVNPLHTGIEQDLRRQADAFPLDQDRHYKKFSADGETVLRILVPLKEADGSIAGYFEGAFLVDQETLARLRREVMTTLLIVLFAVALTTMLVLALIGLVLAVLIPRKPIEATTTPSPGTATASSGKAPTT